MCHAAAFILHIEHFRKAKRLRQRDLAAQTGLAYKRICRLEWGQCDPRLSDLIALAATLEVPIEALYEIGPCNETTTKETA